MSGQIPRRISFSNRKRPLARLRGFTLVELLVVLAILGLLATLVGPRVMSTLSGAKTKTARIQIEDLSGALDIYRLEVGRYPTTDQGLQALVEKPSDAQSWNGPYLKKNQVPTDPWGFEYQYRSPGEHGPYDLWALGADNRQGGEGEDQDVFGWE
jgi:general secretion pathway protein G